MFGGSTPSSSNQFGAAPSSQPSSGSGLFGGSSTSFGQPQQQQSAPGLFGSNTGTSTGSTGLFSSNSSLNAFRPPAAPSANPFALPPPSSTTPLAPSVSSSMFGSSNTGGMGGGMTLGSGLGNTLNSSNSFFNRPAATQPSGSNFVFPTSNAQSSNQPSSTYMNFPNIVPSAPSSSSLSLAPPLPSMYSKSSAFESSHGQIQQIQQIPQIQKSPVKFTPRTSFRIKPRESYNLTAPIPLNFGLSTGTGTQNQIDNHSNLLIPRKLASSNSNLKKLVIPDFSSSSEQFQEEKETTFLAPIVNSTATTITTTNNILTDSMSYGQEYTFPPIKNLKSLSPSDRKEIKNFVIGQKGIGEVRFLLPVDLSEIEPEDLFGHYIEFCEGEAVLYPDPQIVKPDPGQGLNVPAQVRLERIWAISRASRDPIVDPQNEKVILFAQKLKETEGTNFVSYDPLTGTWTFTLNHF